ncbi:hypothetical protein [Bacillus sp. FJAT-45350]|uniref:hypothetical protein n=1 Tax=Bacillus sp. FJAT-45350 TaxID=2011014 RepID=UPI0015CC1CD0|nr:hypothetical protein [Bacillus sp. FJAT-45350]
MKKPKNEIIQDENLTAVEEFSKELDSGITVADQMQTVWEQEVIGDRKNHS